MAGCKAKTNSFYTTESTLWRNAQQVCISCKRLMKSIWWISVSA